MWMIWPPQSKTKKYNKEIDSYCCVAYENLSNSSVSSVSNRTSEQIVSP